MTVDQKHLDRVRLLSARFHELQGLRVALAGVCLALVTGGYLIAVPQPTNNGAIVAMLMAFVPVAALMPRLNRYYGDNFGRQVWNASRYKSAPLFLVPYWILAFYLNAKYPEIPAAAPTVVTVALASVFVALRDWRWRWYYLGITAAAVIGFTVTASGGGTLPPNLTVGTVFGLIGAAMVPVGIIDHLLLVKLMKESRVAGAIPAPGDNFRP